MSIKTPGVQNEHVTIPCFQCRFWQNLLRFTYSLFSVFMVKIGVFLQVVKIFFPKNWFSVTLRSYFSTNKIFPAVSCQHVWGNFFTEKWALKLVSTDFFFNFSHKYRFGLSDFLGPAPKSIFSISTQNFKKSMVNLLKEIAINTVPFFELFIFRKMPGEAFCTLQIPQHVTSSAILASGNLTGRPFIASYACFNVFFRLLFSFEFSYKQFSGFLLVFFTKVAKLQPSASLV